jgi:hypothetical protein
MATAAAIQRRLASYMLASGDYGQPFYGDISRAVIPTHIRDLRDFEPS